MSAFHVGANCVELNVEGGGALGMGVAGRVASDRSGRKDSRAEAGPRTSSLPASLPASHHSRQHIESRSPYMNDTYSRIVSYESARWIVRTLN